jgi:hypothetical protein
MIDISRSYSKIVKMIDDAEPAGAFAITCNLALLADDWRFGPYYGVPKRRKPRAA